MSQKKEEQARVQQEQDEIRRIRLPHPPQTLGVLEQRLGASRLRVKCLDGKTRICRIPGKLKRRLWVRDGDVVIVEPWEFGGDAKGDVVFKYSGTQTEYLRRRGLLDKVQASEEF